MPEQLAHMYSLIKVYFKELNLNVLLLIVQTGTPFPVIFVLLVLKKRCFAGSFLSLIHKIGA